VDSHHQPRMLPLDLLKSKAAYRSELNAKPTTCSE
jgi:hypothetical protein